MLVVDALRSLRRIRIQVTRFEPHQFLVGQSRVLTFEHQHHHKTRRKSQMPQRKTNKKKNQLPAQLRGPRKTIKVSAKDQQALRPILAKYYRSQTRRMQFMMYIDPPGICVVYDQ